jgi:hypothetical protein
MSGYQKHQFAGVLAATGWIAFVLLVRYALPIKTLDQFQFISVLFPLDLNLVNVAILIGIALFFSILPDMDIGTSKVHTILTTAGCLIIIACFFWSLPHLGIMTALSLLFMNFLHHRGIAHSILAGMLLAVPLHLAYGLLYSGAAFVAYLSHLICDKKVKLI